jgi:hypothetical protein
VEHFHFLRRYRESEREKLCRRGRGLRILSTLCCISFLPLMTRPVSNVTCYSHASKARAGRSRNRVSISVGITEFSTAPRQAFSPSKNLIEGMPGMLPGVKSLKRYMSIRLHLLTIHLHYFVLN